MCLTAPWYSDRRRDRGGVRVGAELIKVRVRGAEREERKPLIEAICRDLDAEFVALVGSVATLYRERPADDAVKLKTTKGL